TLKLASLVIKALESHGRSEKHNATLKSQQQTPAITQFCSGSLGASLGPSATQSALSTLTPTTPVSDLRTAFGSTPTLIAEVLWILHMVAKHQSYKSNDDIGELFQTMFPDSDIAKTFKLGKDKTSYITRFGLADFIMRDCCIAHYILIQISIGHETVIEITCILYCMFHRTKIPSILCRLTVHYGCPEGTNLIQYQYTFSP